MHSLQPQQNAQLRPRGHDENILEEAYRGRYARQRLLNFWPESSCGYHAIKRFVCIIQVETDLSSIDVILLEFGKRLHKKAVAVRTLKIREFYDGNGRIL